MADKKLQAVIIFGIISAWSFLSSRIPSTFVLGKYTLYLSILQFIGWVFVIVLILAAIMLGFSQIPSIDSKTKRRLEKGYEGLYALSFKVLLGMMLFTISVNVAILLANFLRKMDIGTLQGILTLGIFGLIIYVLNKRGIRLFEGK